MGFVRARLTLKLHAHLRVHGTGEFRKHKKPNPTESMVLQFAEMLTAEVESPFVLNMENLFTSVNLFRGLRQKGIGACGTTRPAHSEQFPPVLSALKDKRLTTKLLEELSCLCHW